MGALTKNEEWRVGGWGLSPKFFRMRVHLIHKNTFLRGSTHFTFHGGALISYIYISCFHDDVIKWKHVLRHWLLCGEFTGDCGEFTGHQWIPLTQTSEAELWCFLWSAPEQMVWVNNQDAGDLRRHRAHYDVTVMWCRIVIQWSGQPWDLSAFNASLFSNFELVKRVKLGGSVHYGRNGLKFGPLLYPDYHSLKLTIFRTQRQFKFVV